MPHVLAVTESPKASRLLWEELAPHVDVIFVPPSELVGILGLEGVVAIVVDLGGGQDAEGLLVAARDAYPAAVRLVVSEDVDRAALQALIGRGLASAALPLPWREGTVLEAMGGLRQVGSRRRARVLVIDDDAGFCELTKAWLEKDHDVVAAHDGEEGLRVAQALRPDVVLLDIMMPKLSGFSVGWVFEHDPRHQGTAVVFVTALRREDTRIGRAAGFLQKPFRRKELVDAIDAALARVGAAPPLPALPAVDDRRLMPRLGVDLPASLRSDGLSVSAIIRSLSVGGACVECDSAVASGSTAVLSFETPQGSFVADCCILYRSQGAPGYGIGLRFVALTAEAEQVLTDVLSAHA